MKLRFLFLVSIVSMFAGLIRPATAEEFFVGNPRSGLWHKVIHYKEADMRPFWFGGTLRCENAFPVTRAAQEQEFGVSVVLKHTDGTESWKPFARWNAGSHDWETAQNVFYPKKPVASATVRVRAHPGPGTSEYRDIFVRREDPGLSISRWRRVTDRPFADRDFLFVAFPRAYDWKSECAGLKASGKRKTRAFVPVPSRVGGEVTLHLSCDGKTSVQKIAFGPSKLPVSPVDSGKVRVWTEDSMRAITPLTFPKPNAVSNINIFVARRGSASSQLLITTPEGESLEGASLSISQLKTSSGNVLNGNVKWQRLGYVRRHPDAILHPLAPDREIRWLPDPLLPASTMNVRAGSTQGAWVTVHAKSNAVPGLYRGTIDVKSQSRILASVPIAVRVLPFEQPAIFSCPSIHAMYESHVFRVYGNRGHEMLERVYDMVLDHRINPDGCGTRWYEPIPIATLKKWRARGMSLTSAMALNVKAPREDTTWISHPTVEQVKDPSFYTGIRDRLKPYVEELRANNLLSCVYVYGFDESTDALFPGIGEFWRKFKSDFPEVPMMTTAFMYRRRAEGKTVDDWTMTDWHCPGMPYWRAELTDELHRQGKQAWWYICCGPSYPRLNVGLEHPPLEGRLLTWQQYKESCDGVFNWGINYWHRRKQVDDSDVFLHEWQYGAGMSGMTGDGIMIYPGKSGPLSSIRLANVRDGIQDYEWMKAAERFAGRPAIEQIVSQIVSSQTQICREPERINAARLSLIQLLTRPTSETP